jgi:ribosome-associated protein
MSALIWVGRGLVIDDAEISFGFVRSPGPGGQNVNKVATAVRLRFDLRRSASLRGDVRERLARLAGKRLGKDGVLTILARRYRTQEANRRDAVERLIALVRRASVRPRVRRPTKPTAAAKKRRLEAKRLRGRTKAGRRPVGKTED